MTDIAELGIRFTPIGFEETGRAFKDVTAGAEKVEGATKKMTATQQAAANTHRMVADAARYNVSALGQVAQAVAQADAAQKAALRSTQALGAQVQMAAAQAKAATASFDTFYDAAQRDFSTQYVRQAGKAAAASKLMGHEVLNLTRQFSDIGVTAAMGMSPLMILIQQGPQIGETLAMAKARGVSFSAALREMAVAGWAAVAPLAPFIVAAGAVAAVLGGGLLLATKELNDQHKDLAKTLGLTEEQLKKVKNEGVTAGDVLKGTFLAAGAALKEAFAPQLEWLRGAFSATYQFILKATMGAVEGIVKTFGGAIGLLGGLWKNFPAIVGDAVVSGANLALAAVEKLVNGAIGLLNKLIGQANALSAKVGGPQFGAMGAVSIGKLNNANAGALSDLRAAQVKGEASALAGLAGAYKAVEASILKVAEARIREEAGTAKAAKALRDHTKALKENIDRSQPIGADLSKTVDLDVTKSAKLPKAVGDLKTIHDEAYRAKDAMEEFYKAANEAGSGVDQLFHGLKNRDWTSAVAGLLRAAKAIKDAFGKGGTTAGKIGAVAGVADVIGQAVGGPGGSALSGAAAGAMAGLMTPLGPIGAAIGAVVGGIAGWFTGNKAKKQAAAEAARQAAEAAAQHALDVANQRREIELNIIALSGDAVATLAAQREAELAGIDESNKALARQMYDLQDAKRRNDERAALELRYMQATGDAAGVLAAQRAEEAKGIDATNRALLDLVYAQEDYAGRLATAKDDLSAAYEREAAAIGATQEKFSGLAKTLREFGDSLDPATQAGGGSYSAARFKFLRTASGTDAESLAGIPDAGRAFIAASAANSRSLLAYQRDVATVRNATRAGENSATSQASIAEQQLGALKAQVGGLITLNNSVLSLPAAIAALLAVQATAPAPAPATAFAGPNWSNYLAANPDVMAGYQAFAAGGGDQVSYAGITSAVDYAARHYTLAGKAEGRTGFATGGSFTVGGSGGPDSQAFNLALSPGEMVNVRRPGDAANDDAKEEIRGLRAQVAELTTVVRGMAADTAKLRSNIQSATEDGRAMQTEAYA